uniref:Porin n=1 Tax=Desulfatirhabdium butyrativorans TaxID=340467 RepID=A0A7C4VR62_9BACT
MKTRIGLKPRCVLFTCILALIGTFIIPSNGRADTIEDLKQQIQLLQKKVEMLEKQQAETKAAVAAVPAPAAPQAPAKKLPPGYFMVPGTDTELRINGYAKLDVVWSDVKSGENATEDNDEFLSAFTIPLSNTPNLERNHLVFTARQTRLNVGTSTKTAYGPLTTYFEGDFYGGGAGIAGAGNQVVSNGYEFRLRHAFGTLGPFLAGQTWSTIMSLPSIPETVDFGGPSAQLFVRTPQLRWTQPVPEFGDVQFAVENPQTYVYNEKGAKASYDDDRIPDVILKATYKQPWGQLSLGGVLRQLRYDDGLNHDDTIGGFGSFAGMIKTFDKDDIRFQINYGNAIGRYQYTLFGDGILKPDKTLDTLTQWGGFVAYRHFWMEGLRSNIVYSYGAADNDMDILTSAAAGVINKNIQTGHLNLIWSPVPKIDLGLEYIYGYREVENGQDGTLNRIQFGAQYNFF